MEASIVSTPEIGIQCLCIDGTLAQFQVDLGIIVNVVDAHFFFDRVPTKDHRRFVAGVVRARCY